MTVMLRRYSGFSPEIFEKGLVLRMRGSSLFLYLFLCRTSDRKSSLQFKASDKEISEQTGASPRALCDARRNLATLGLIHCERCPGGMYTYSLCDPETGRPFPGDPKTKAQYVKKEKPAPAERPTAWRTTLSPASEKPASHETSAGDTSFNFGYNDWPPDMVYFPIDAYDRPR